MLKPQLKMLAKTVGVVVEPSKASARRLIGAAKVEFAVGMDGATSLEAALERSVFLDSVMCVLTRPTTAL